MAYCTSGNYNNDVNYNDERTVEKTVEVTCSGTGFYAIGEEVTMRPFFNQEWTTYVIIVFLSVDDGGLFNYVITTPTETKEGTSTGSFNMDVTGFANYERVVGSNRFTRSDGKYFVEINAHSTFPIFKKDDVDSINAYISTGDTSGALNSRELNGSKCTIFITNNGDRIEFNTQPNKEDVTELLYTHIEVKLIDSTGVGSFHKFNIPIVGKYTTSWDAQASFSVQSTLIMTITIYDGSEMVAQFSSIKLTKKFLGVVGNVGVNPANGENNGYRYESSTNNSFDEVGEDGENNSDATGGNRDGSEFGGFSNMLATYQITKQALADLGSFIWNNSIFDDIKNLNNSPLENVVSLMYMPIDIGGEEKNIVLGNITTNVSGTKCSQNMKKVEIGSFSIPYYTTGFLNYEPYTSISLYLPLVGMVTLQSKDVVGQTVTVEYAYDVVVGSFGAFVYTSKGGGKTLIYSSQGTCAITIPLTASNQAQVQASILSSGVGLVSDTLVGDSMGALNNAANILTTQNHSTTFGSASSMIGALSPSYCYYIIRTPITSLPSTFAHSHGWLCMQTYLLSSLKGFTVIERIELDGLYAMDEELAELKQILTTGFYL